ncbi:MAG: hypothetical protein IJU03_09660 [Thermoguttaceae bacterium]|nr:hypothetical protein [Thermoguttaceae bacterium]
MQNIWSFFVAVIRSFFNSEIRTPHQVKGRCSCFENLENRLALSASLPASDLILIKEAFIHENLSSLVSAYDATTSATAPSIDLTDLLETAILDEDDALFEEDYELTVDGAVAVNLSVNNYELSSSAVEAGATNAYAELVAESEALEIEDVSETPLSEIDFKGDLNAETDYYFEQYGVYINGSRCISLSDAAKLPQSFLTRVADARRSESLSASSEQGGSRSGGGGSELEEVDIALGIGHGLASGSPALHVNAVNPICEGLSPYSEYKTTTEYLAGDYMEVLLPALPIGYESQVTFGGTALSSVDYLAYVGYPPASLNYVPFGFDHSGGAETVYIFPVEDALKEDDETAIVFMGTPHLSGSGGVDTHTFNMLVSSATATIIDNDQWKIDITPESAYANLDEIVITEGNQASQGGTPTNKVSFTISREEDVEYHAGDNHYPINVRLQFQNGTATFNDYKILHPQPNGTIAWLTPNFSNEVTVTIPAGANSTTITIEAIDDSIIERLYETLSFRIVSAWSTSNSFSYDSTSYAIKIKDNDSLYLDTVQYLGNIDLVSDTQGTFGTHWGNATHWVNNYPQYTLPVAYSSYNVMQCESVTIGNVDPEVDVTVRFGWKYRDLNGVLQIAYSNWTSRSISTGISTNQLLNQFRTLFGDESAYYDLDSCLEWEFRVNNEDRGDDGRFGGNVNPLYVTYKPPVGYPNGVYHSVVDIGCRAAHRTAGGDSEQTVFIKIWDKFETLTINKVDLIQGIVSQGELLTYYGKDVSNNSMIIPVKNHLSINKIGTNDYSLTQLPSLARELSVFPSQHYDANSQQLRHPTESINAYTTDSLLYFKDGLCGTWDDFATDVFAAQGITVTKVSISVNNIDGYQYPRFQVKNNVQGQGNIIPRENTWLNHALLLYNNVIYDPSYGTSYGSISSFKNNFINKVDSVGHRIDATGTASQLHYGYWYIPDKTASQNEIETWDFTYTVLM